MSSLRDQKALNQARFGRFADEYVRSQSLAAGADLERLVEICRAEPDWVVLDVATGGGHTALKFAALVGHVIATDLSHVMLVKARTHVSSHGAGNLSFHQADAENLPFPGNCFHLVTCRIAPHHFSDVPRFVQEAARVLVPGGVLLVQDLVLPDDPLAASVVDGFEKLRDPAHNRAFTQHGWEAMFTAAALPVLHAELITKRHRFLSWAERQGCSPQVIARLREIMARAPEAARDWMQPQDFDTPQATFANRHLILLGQK